jgi:hypothetical protein
VGSDHGGQEYLAEAAAATRKRSGIGLGDDVRRLSRIEVALVLGEQ